MCPLLRTVAEWNFPCSAQTRTRQGGVRRGLENRVPALLCHGYHRVVCDTEVRPTIWLLSWCTDVCCLG